MANPGGIRAGRAFVEVGLDKTKFVKGLRQAEAQLKEFGRKVQELGKKFVFAGGMISLPFAVSTKVFVDFDDQMKTVQAVTRATGKEFDLLTEKAKHLGRTTSFTAAQVASGMVVLGRQGFSSREIDQSIAGVLALARATGTDLAEAAMYASDTLRAFGLDAGQMDRVVDVMTATANNSAQTLEDLGQSMKYAAPIAQKYGSSLEETANALGILANVGIKGSLAGTGLRASMTRLADPKIRKRLREIGVEVGNVQGNMREFLRIMKEIGKATESMGSMQRLSILNEIFGRRALSAGASLTTESFERLEKAIADSSGTAQTTMNVMESGLGGSFRRLKSAVEGVALAVGKSLEVPLMIASNIIKEISLQMVSFIDKNRKLVVQLASIGVSLIAVGGLLIGLGVAIKLVAFGVSTVITILGTLKFAIIAVNTVLAITQGALLMLTSPVGMVAGAFAGLAAGVILSSNKALNGIKNLSDGVGKLKSEMTAAWIEIADAMKTGNIGIAAKIAWLTIKMEFARGVYSIKSIWAGFENWFLTVANDAWAGVLSGWQLLQKGIMIAFVESKAKLLNEWENLKLGIYKIANWIQDIWENATDAIAGFIIKTIAEIAKLIEAFKIANQKRSEHKFNPARAFFEAKAEIKKMWEEDAFLKELQKELESDKQDRKEERALKLKEVEDAKIARQNEIEAERKAIRDGIDEGISDGLSKILGKNADRQSDIDSRYEQKVKEYQSDFDAAKKEWSDAVGGSKTTRAERNRQEGLSSRSLLKENYDRLLNEARKIIGERSIFMELTRGVSTKADKEMRRKGIEDYNRRLSEKRSEMGDIRNQLGGVHGKRLTAKERFEKFMENMTAGLNPLMAGFEGNSSGSFSGYARFGMSGQISAMDRTATATEKIAQNTKEMLDIEKRRDIEDEEDVF